jgi:deazaflavin-dependent oxidoreductase (nitroreductase family)
LTYVRDESGRLLVSGGAVGQTRTPDWVANLRAEPNCEVIIDKTRTPVCAIELAGDERDRGWERFGEELPKLKARMAAYERRSQRRIPVFRLEVS